MQLSPRNAVEFTLLTVRRQDQSVIFLADPILHYGMITACQEYPDGVIFTQPPQKYVQTGMTSQS